MDPYRPIACSLHDQYLAWATERRVVVVSYQDGSGGHHTVKDLIKDVYTREDGTEWMVLANGLEIRLDLIKHAEPT